MLNVRLCIEIQWYSVPDVLYISFSNQTMRFLPNVRLSNHCRFYLEKTYNLETHWRSHSMIRIDRSREILSTHLRNSKIQNDSKFLFKMPPVIVIIKSWPGVLNLVYEYDIIYFEEAI